MKSLLPLVIPLSFLMSTATASAQDIPAGDLQVVKRPISNIRTQCVNNPLGKKDQPNTVHGCKFTFLKSNLEFSPIESNLYFNDKECMAEFRIIKGAASAAFGFTQKYENMENSYVCLERLFTKVYQTSNPTVEAIVYTTK